MGRLGCSTISFRAWPLPDALEMIRELGFAEIDLGVLPGVCLHAPVSPSERDIDSIRAVVEEAGVTVRLVNSDPGDLNDPGLTPDRWRASLQTLSGLARALSAPLLSVPCGRAAAQPFRDLDRDLRLVATRLIEGAQVAAEFGIRLVVEAPHLRRLCCNVDRAERLLRMVDPSLCGLVLDVSHVCASGSDSVDWAHRMIARIDHVQLRDARPGDINVSIGRGAVDFGAVIAEMTRGGYRGHYTLELETHDINNAQRLEATGAARDAIVAAMRRSRHQSIEAGTGSPHKPPAAGRAPL